MQALISGLMGEETQQKIVDFQPIPSSPQERAYHSTADIVGYGGAAGGGKSYLLLGKAFTKHRRSRILRANYTDLQRLIDDGDAMLDGIARYVYAPKRRWDLPDGRAVMLRAVERIADIRKHKGDRVDFLGFDEADQFTEPIVRLMMGWAGTTDTRQPVQIMLCFNPPDLDGEWLLQFFAPWVDDNYPNPAQDGELRWFIYHDGKDVEVESNDPITIDAETYYPKSRTFFKALVTDNPYAMATGYDKTLNAMPEPYRSMYYKGLFNVLQQDDAFQVIPTAWILEAEKRWVEMERPNVAMASLGADVARGGDDKTVLAPRYGTYFDELAIYNGTETPDGYAVENLVLKAIGDSSPTVNIDVIGIGSSAYDLLKVYKTFNTVPINSSKSTKLLDKSGKYGFANVRSAMWWKFREALDPTSGENIALPPSRTLRNDLRAPRYKMRAGKYVIESKPDIKKRLNRSPDEGDAVVMAWFEDSVRKASVIQIPDIYGRDL